MHTHRVKRLPVVDLDGKLVGVVSRIDVLSVFDRPDEQIRDGVSKGVIARGLGLDSALDAVGVEVTVSSGIVTVTGSVTRRETAMRLLEAIRHSDGVVGVRDRLSYPRDDQVAAAR